ncbi:MAG: GDSL-type esterase/lipase family protein [Mariniblastus sp.]|nr:GDSL-type esterase/lipase family protein [Mariniblastus sp.]
MTIPRFLMTGLIWSFGLCSVSLASAPEEFRSDGLSLEKGDRICLVGNALGERMQHHNYWESLLHAEYPQLNLVVRNLCFPGDEPLERIRSKNFGDPESHLKHSQASVVLFFFGLNESFDGKAGLKKFKTDLTELVKTTLADDYDGDGQPSRVVLISPVPFEETGNPNWSDGKEENKRLKMYADTMRQVAENTGVQFADVFEPTRQLFDESEETLTLNGVHLNRAGYQKFAPILMQALFGNGAGQKLDGHAKRAALHEEINDKNFHWWHRYRSVNGFSIYGDRGKAGKDGTGTYNNRDVMERERSILDEMVANRDARIWALASKQDVAGQVDDSNTLPFINPQTNVGAANDPNKGKGKLGTLDYLTAEDQKKLFKLAPGYEINLVASEEQFPELANPVAINFDNQGRLWVATMESYPHWKPKTPMNDKLLILEDTDQDGVADDCKVFADGLHQPTGFEIGNDGVYIAQQPDILFAKDTDGDDRADEMVRQLIGFDSADSHHGIAAFQWGPGGVLYFQEGTFKFSQVESPYGLTRLREAGVWKYEPKTEKFGVHSSFSFSNPWGHIFDRWGQDFIGDASPGFSFWAAPISGRIEHPYKHGGGGHDKRVQEFVGRDKGFKFKTLYKKRTRPLAGCEIVSSRHFPDDVQGNWLVTNCIGERCVLSHKIEEQESGFWGTEMPPIVSCDDGNFRPVDIEFAPDGSLYIVDWHNALIGHLQHNLRDPSRDHSHGRIWRVTYKDRPLLTPPTIEGAPIPELLDLLKAYEDRTRYRAKRELAERDTEQVMAALQTWLAGLDPDDENFEHQQLEALWLCQTHNQVNEALLQKVLASKDHRARAAGIRVLSFWIDRVDEPLGILKKHVADEHPRVRLESVRALSFMSGDEAMETALGVLDFEMDYYLQYTLDETMRMLEMQ